MEKEIEERKKKRDQFYDEAKNSIKMVYDREIGFNEAIIQSSTSHIHRTVIIICTLAIGYIYHEHLENWMMIPFYAGLFLSFFHMVFRLFISQKRKFWLEAGESEILLKGQIEDLELHQQTTSLSRIGFSLQASNALLTFSNYLLAVFLVLEVLCMLFGIALFFFVKLMIPQSLGQV